MRYDASCSYKRAFSVFSTNYGLNCSAICFHHYTITLWT